MIEWRAGSGSTPRLRFLLTLLYALVLVTCSQPASSPSESDEATRFNGTWATRAAEFRVWAIDERRLQVEFRGEHEYESSLGPMVNVGTAAGVAAVEDGTVTLRPDGVEGCAITLRMSGERLEVKETGACGFGLNVTAAGTYDRVSREQPEFGTSG